MTTIYEKHDAAFKQISAYVVIKDNQRIATIAFKRGATGNVKCFLHQIGLPMVEGNAGGGGYDKQSAAFYDAASKNYKSEQKKQITGNDVADYGAFILAQAIYEAAKHGNGASHFDRALSDAGLTIFQAV